MEIDRFNRMTASAESARPPARPTKYAFLRGPGWRSATPSPGPGPPCRALTYLRIVSTELEREKEKQGRKERRPKNAEGKKRARWSRKNFLVSLA